MLQPNKSLVQALEVAACKKDVQSRWELFRELLGSVLWIAVDGQADADKHEGEDRGSRTSLLRLGNSDGAAAVLAFTDPDALARWRVNSPFVMLPAKELFEKLIPVKVYCVIINIGGPIDAIIERNSFGLLGQGIIPIAAPSEQLDFAVGETMFFRNTTEHTAILLAEPLHKAMESMAGVLEAFLMDLVDVKTGSGSLFLGIHFSDDVSPEVKKNLMNQLGAIPTQLLPKGASVLIRNMSASGVKQISGRIQPLFRRV